ncbi:MAG TPA: hypothetical protein VHD60_02655 [Candidatus Saccharimonadales bacterium]|nr:hypothetical protein [Candidatus Saccharimonadales bacterium]
MLSIILLLIIIFIAAGIIGFVVHGLFWLFILAAVLFALTIVFGLMTAGSRRERRRASHVVPPPDDTKE